jgi:hypothetical protein
MSNQGDVSFDAQYLGRFENDLRTPIGMKHKSTASFYKKGAPADAGAPGSQWQLA